MADAADFYGINDLAQFNQTVQQNDPYGIAGRTLGAFRPDMSTWSAPTQGISAFGQAFLSGMLGNYARQNAADQMNSVIGVLPQLKANPLAVTAPEGVDADAFAALKGNAIMRNFQAQAEGGTEKKKNIQQLMSSIFGEGVKTGAIAPGDAIQAIESGDYSKIIDNPSDPKKNPDSREYKVEKDSEDRLITLRKEFNALEPVKNFAKASQAATALAGALKDPSKVADQELVRYSILMIEPGMAVREGEQGAVANSQSIPDAWKGQLESALTGKSALGPDVREGIKQLASRAYNSHKGLYDQANEMYSKEATLQGLDPSRLSYIGQAPEATSIFGSAPQLTQETYNQLRAQGLSKDEIKAQYGM